MSEALRPRNLLPSEFSFSHEFSLYLHDCMVHFIVEGERRRLFLTKINFASPEQAKELRENPDLFILDWLEEKGYSQELGEVVLKTMFPALLSDFCHFVFEALSCSRKAKLTVAYALLRKPLRENLHYLEWMLADPEGLLNTFYYKPSKELSFNAIGCSPEKMTAVIQKAIDRTVHRKTYTASFLYDMRFNKNAHFGYDAMCNRAMHLVTTKPGLTTEQQNFNFVFSGEAERHAQWEHIYNTLPYLLFYALDICEVLMALLTSEVAAEIGKAHYKRAIGFILWAIQSSRFTNQKHVELPLPELPLLDCPKCGRKIQTDERQLAELYYAQEIKCPHCVKKVEMPRIVKAS